MKRALPLLTTLITTLFGCGLTGDGGMSPPPDDCPAALPSAAVTTSSGAQQATLDTEGAWTAVTWATSEIAAGSDNTDVTYLLAQPGSLTAVRREARRRRVMDAELKRLVYTPERLERLEARERIEQVAIDIARLARTELDSAGD